MKKGLKITYDKEADAMYIYLNERKIDHTKEVSNLVFVDVDSKNKPVGIEILNVSRRLGRSIIGTEKLKTKSKNIFSSIPVEILSKTPVFA